MTTITARVEEYEEAGWVYIQDGVGWTSGVWLHEEYGSVNKGGGTFTWIGEAVAALEKFIKAKSQLELVA